jgi:Dolichyl-phosphate-mannose-protein mannosyltransferase
LPRPSGCESLGALFFLVHLLALLVLATTVYVTGRLLTRHLPGDLDDQGEERFAVAVTLGLAVWGSLGLLLGLAGLLARGSLLAAAAGIHLAGLGVWREMGRGARALLGGDGRRRRGWALLGIAAVLLPIAALALYPPTAFDETLYHLPFARAFARTGGVPFLPELRTPVFPQLSEVVFAEVLLLADDVAVHFVELLATVAVAALLVGWGRRASGSTSAGWLAAAVWLGNPIVVYLSGTAYLEPGLALFGTAALYARERWRESGSRGWLALAAGFAGSAAGTKYLGAAFCGLIVLLTLTAAPRERRLRDLALVILVAGAVAGPWYARILFYTGNPVFPFFPGLFGPPTVWDTVWAQEHLSVGARVSAFLRIPWAVVFDRRQVGNQPPHSPVYLLGLPFLALGAWRDPRVLRLLGAVLGYALIFLVLVPDARYLVAVLPALSLALALSISPLLRRPRLAVAVALAVLLPGWLYAGYLLVRQGPVPVTAAARDRYLERRLRVWPAVRFLNRTRGSRYTVYAFHAENMVYLAQGKLLGDWNGPGRFDAVQPLTRDPAALQRKLRALGADSLLVVDGSGVALPYDDPAFQARFRRIYSDGAAEVFEIAPSGP